MTAITITIAEEAVSYEDIPIDITSTLPSRGWPEIGAFLQIVVQQDVCEDVNTEFNGAF